MPLYATRCVCPQCDGSGSVTTSSGADSAMIPCNWPGCNGTGYVEHGDLSLPVELDAVLSDIQDKVNDIKEKVDEIKAWVDTQ